MSLKIERRLKLRKICGDNEISIKLSKSMTSDNDQKRKSASSSMINFTSETFSSSSPPKLDVNSEKKVHRKKIRSTQDFNQLNNSLTSQDSDELTKTKPKKTKKSKKAYRLPRISQMAIDFAADTKNIFSDDELVRKKRKKRKVRNHSNDAVSEGKCQSQRKKENKIKEDKAEVLLDSNKSRSKESDKKLSSSEAYESANSKSDSLNGSDEEIIFKCKPKLQKQNRIEKNVSNIGEDKCDIAERYMESDVLNTRSRNSKAYKSLCLSTPLSGEKREQNKKLNMKGTKCETTPKGDKSSVCSDNQGEIKKQSILSNSSRRISSTPYPKKKLPKTPLTDHKEDGRQSIAKRSRANNLSQKFSSEVAIVKVKNKNDSRTTSLTANISFGLDYDSDDVFDETLKKKSDDENTIGNQNEQSVRHIVSNNRISIKPRKSVRFLSPEQNVKRETLTLSKTTSDNMIKKSDECNSDNAILTQSFAEDRKSSNGTIRRNSTFEITSPKVINQIIPPDVPQNKISFNQSLSKRSCSSSNKSLRRSRLQENSIIDLTTPVSFKKINSVIASNNEKLNISGVGSLEKLNRQSTFSKDDETTAVHTESAPIAVNNETVVNTLHLPSLVRTATFTKENDERSQHLPADLKYSPLPSDTSYSNVIDTSKVNKRKRWDKSRLSTSFLDNSLNIGDITAPWQGDDSMTLNSSDVNVDKRSMDLQVVSATSTPYPKGKTTLLKQALLKDKSNVAANESKNRTMLNEKPVPKVARTKIPNFALIHQRALDKLENIKEMSERKAARAKLLLSGRKPPSDTSQKASTKRKELKFSPDKLKSSINKDKNSSSRSLLTSNILVTKIKDISPSKSNPKAANKENKFTTVEKKKDILKTKSLIPKPKLPNAVIAGKNGFTRFGFKMGPEGVKKTTRDQQVKAVATKSKVIKNTLDERRNLIQGVRSNRRFELLMNMRIK